ncbi:MAG: UDP-N-acetylmuramate dehydrogenase [bacterium]|nr:UDP-N-acetylmuramate dehydrogenase [bacterium]
MNTLLIEILKKELPDLQEGVILAPYTTFTIGGPAQYFLEVKTQEQLVHAVRVARLHNVPFFLLAKGSNVLVSDVGFPGLIIYVRANAWSIEGISLKAEAGVLMSELVEETCKRGMKGFEWAGGLPGTLGGAVRGNAGAFGGEMKDNVVSVTYLNNQGEVQVIQKDECAFGYRNSLFKEKGFPVLLAEFRFTEADPKELQDTAQSRIAYRKERHPLEYPNAGSMFKNVPLSSVSESLHEFVSQAVKQDPFPVVPAAFLIAQANLKGMREGGAQVSEKHPNYIVNIGGARAKDVINLVLRVKEKIASQFGIQLEEEVTIL